MNNHTNCKDENNNGQYFYNGEAALLPQESNEL